MLEIRFKFGYPWPLRWKLLRIVMNFYMNKCSLILWCQFITNIHEFDGKPLQQNVINVNIFETFT